MLSVAERTATLQPPKSKTQKGPGGEGRKSYFRHPQFSGAANNQDPFRVAKNTPTAPRQPLYPTLQGVMTERTATTWGKNNPTFFAGSARPPTPSNSVFSEAKKRHRGR